jgi:hypothetical protein
VSADSLEMTGQCDVAINQLATINENTNKRRSTQNHSTCNSIPKLVGSLLDSSSRSPKKQAHKNLECAEPSPIQRIGKLSYLLPNQVNDQAISGVVFATRDRVFHRLTPPKGIFGIRSQPSTVILITVYSCGAHKNLECALPNEWPNRALLYLKRKVFISVTRSSEWSGNQRCCICYQRQGISQTHSPEGNLWY